MWPKELFNWQRVGGGWNELNLNCTTATCLLIMWPSIFITHTHTPLILLHNKWTEQTWPHEIRLQGSVGSGWCLLTLKQYFIITAAVIEDTSPCHPIRLLKIIVDYEEELERGDFFFFAQMKVKCSSLQFFLLLFHSPGLCSQVPNTALCKSESEITWGGEEK